MQYLRNKQPLIFAPLNASSLLLLMGCVVIRNNSQTPIEFDAETASYTRDENIGFRAGEIVHTPTLQTSPLNAVFSIEVADPRLQNLLSIDPETGVVTATGDFTPDYDAGDREFEIVIIASNDFQDARQTVTLRIKDINDSAPIFEPAPASANTVAENQTYSQSFKANPDAQEDGVSISYSLSGADASNFTINAQTGVVTANAPMDYEASKKEYNFSIIATAIKTNPDGTTSVLQYNNVNLPTARQDITLKVSNVNDSAPVIDTSITATPRPENTNISSSTVIYDAEGTYDAVPIKWSLKANNNDDAALFDIDETTGEVTFKSDTMPDNDVKASYSFTLVATSGSYSDEHNVTLNIIDLNETAPDITSSATPSAVNEGTAYSTSAAFYTADATYDASVIWSLKTVAGDDANLFDIDSSTGVVTFKNATTLDHESKSIYTFTVVATSPATPSDFTDEQIVTINVTDVNDVAPVIDTSITAAARAENTAISASTVIYDADGTYDVTPITWSLKAGGDAALFAIDSSSGEVTFKSATTPNHEAKSSYSFTVVATSGSLSDEHTVTMNITDVNDIAPSITSSASYHVDNGVSYSTSDVVYIAQGIPDVTAIVWSLKTGGDASLFDIDSGTGDVTFASQTTPDIGTKSSYSFTIIATSGSFSSERAVTINVVDNFINKITSDGGDTIFGTSSGETIAGSHLPDFINAGAGDDTITTNNTINTGDIINGGAGVDTASYASSTSGVVVYLGGIKDANGFITAAGGEAHGDKLKNIENIIGSNFNDTLTGDDGNNILTAGSGHDNLNGGAGNDRLIAGVGNLLADGGAGTDTLSYHGYGTGITIDLNGSTNATGYINLGTGDSYSHAFKNIENFVGTDYIDVISGNDGANILRGNAGDDRIYGFGGNDMLVGDDGDDQLYAGAGTDVLIGGRGNDRIELGAGTDHVIVVFNSHANDAGQWELTDGNDTIINFKRAEDTLFFSDATQKAGVTPITMESVFAEDEDAPIIKAQFETSAGKKYVSQLTFAFALNDGVTTVNFDATNRYEVTDESLFDADFILTDYTMLQTIFGGENYFCMKDYDELQTSLDVI